MRTQLLSTLGLFGALWVVDAHAANVTTPPPTPPPTPGITDERRKPEEPPHGNTKMQYGRDSAGYYKEGYDGPNMTSRSVPEYSSVQEPNWTTFNLDPKHFGEKNGWRTSNITTVPKEDEPDTCKISE